MVGHIVMWKLQDSAAGKSAAENAATMKAMLEALPAAISFLRKLVVSTSVFASSPEVDVVLYTEFDSPEDLQSYQVHPEHQKCVQFVSGVVAERRVVDYTF
ncbi:MAG: Dabb family protein [Desulfovibrionales bacterium]|nr:Dabb family protein [Desulfovibrionales bacterium]